MDRVFLIGRGNERNMNGSKIFEMPLHFGQTSVDFSWPWNSRTMTLWFLRRYFIQVSSAISWRWTQLLSPLYHILLGQTLTEKDNGNNKRMSDNNRNSQHTSNCALSLATWKVYNSSRLQRFISNSRNVSIPSFLLATSKRTKLLILLMATSSICALFAQRVFRSPQRPNTKPQYIIIYTVAHTYVLLDIQFISAGANSVYKSML